MPILKHVTDVDIPSNCVSILLGELLEKKKCVKFTLVLFLEGWNLISVVSDIHEFLCGISASLHLHVLSFPKGLNF